MIKLVVIFALLIVSSAVAHASPQGTFWQSDDGTWSLVGLASDAADETSMVMASGCSALAPMQP